MYEYKMSDAADTILKFKTDEAVFYPTETSGLLIEACRANIKRPGKTLDLGCGMGITGLVISRLGLWAGALVA